MASIKNLKKEINYVIGDILEVVYLHEMTSTGKPSEESEKIVQECFDTFDDLIEKVNDRSVEKRGLHLKNVRKELEERAIAIVEKVNAL